MTARTKLVVSTRDRLERYIARDAALGCWRWTGNIDRGAPGNFYAGEDVVKPARTVAWELDHGPVPEGQFVASTCRDRLCIAPAHAELRARAQKLTPDVVRDIRRRRRAGEGLSAIARRYSIARSSAHAIVHGFTHKWIE